MAGMASAVARERARKAASSADALGPRDSATVFVTLSLQPAAQAAAAMGVTVVVAWASSMAEEA
jgi:hypothetical protein